MTDMLILGGRRRRGRPPSDAPKSHVTIYMPNELQDRLAQLALKRGVSVSTVVCQVLEEALRRAAAGISVQNKSPR